MDLCIDIGRDKRVEQKGERRRSEPVCESRVGIERMRSMEQFRDIRNQGEEKRTAAMHRCMNGPVH